MKFCEYQNGPTIKIEQKPLSIFEKFVQLKPNEKEAGGQLFGIFKGAETIIVEATVPKWLDKRNRYSFIPSIFLQQREISLKHSKGLHYIGDWHTHPEAIPHPSQTDIRSMNECFRLSLHDLKSFVMIIVGTSHPPEGLYVALIKANNMIRLQIKTE